VSGDREDDPSGNEGGGRQDGASGAGQAAAPAPGQGPDLVRAALASARAAARASGINPGAPARRPRRVAPVRSGSGADARDPEPLGSAVRRLVEERGWQDTSAAASVLARWDELVGPELAQHCRPASLLDGELVLVAESSAWATQLRLLTRTLQARLTAQVGKGVVTSVVVRGPAQPDWRRGPRRVRGRGPRDTYG
jgi:predicted nucleic acid-binding Zn ribbon protein